MTFYLNAIRYIIIPTVKQQLYSIQIIIKKKTKAHPANLINVFNTTTGLGDVGVSIISDMQLSARNTNTNNNLFGLQHSYALKGKGLHWINVPSYAEPLINVIKSMVKKKIVERMHFYSEPEELLNIFPKSILPRDYGGEEQSCEEINSKEI